MRLVVITRQVRTHIYLSKWLEGCRDTILLPSFFFEYIIDMAMCVVKALIGCPP